MPYLVAYLGYFVLKLPVNPGSGRALLPLLHLYWILHGAHFALGLLALGSWCRITWSGGQRIRLGRVLPWLLLALFLNVPGSYLEWPSDPWMHYWRIGHWSGLEEIRGHEFWFKSSYFLTYSVLQLGAFELQMDWLEAYYTATCLLLCWQYFRLARSVGLGAPLALVFVLVQACFLGNSIFSFYRYYGISSTIFAQLAVVALIRMALEFARGDHHVLDSRDEIRGALGPAFPSWIAPGIGACGLGLLIAFNHAQGLGLAGLGLAAVAVWRVLQLRRSWGWWLLAGALASSVVTVCCWPRHDAIDQLYRPSHMFSFLYGFNIFSLSSPASLRMWDVMGFAGAASALAGAWLIVKKNDVTGWLSVMPFLALSLPVVAIPFAGVLAGRFGRLDDIISFSRMFLVIPVGLAIVRVGQELMPQAGNVAQRYFLFPILREPIFPLLPGALLVLMVVPSGRPWYNRFWNAVAVSPADLELRHISRVFEEPRFSSMAGRSPLRLVTTPATGYVAVAMGIKPASPAGKPHWNPIAPSAEVVLGMVTSATSKRDYRIAWVPAWQNLTTPASLAGRLTGHWLLHAVALDHAAGSEIEAALRQTRWSLAPGLRGTFAIPGGPVDR